VQRNIKIYCTRYGNNSFYFERSSANEARTLSDIVLIV
jgi:hypothetical protein